MPGDFVKFIKFENLETLRLKDFDQYQRLKFGRTLLGLMVLFICIPISTYLVWLFYAQTGNANPIALLSFWVLIFMVLLYPCLRILGIMQDKKFGKFKRTAEQERLHQQKRLEYLSGRDERKKKDNETRRFVFIFAIFYLPLSAIFITLEHVFGLLRGKAMHVAFWSSGILALVVSHKMNKTIRNKRGDQ